MPATGHETSRPVIKVIEEESAAFWNDAASMPAGCRPHRTIAGTGPSATPRTRVA